MKSYTVEDIFGERWLLAGGPKTGKSSMAESFPKKLVVLDCDGAQNKYVYDGSDCEKIVCESVKDVRQGIKHIARYEYATCVLDPVDRLVTWLSQDISRRSQKSCIADIKYGVGWGRLHAVVIDLITQFWAACETSSGLVASIIVAHAKTGDEGIKSMAVNKSLIDWFQGSVNNIGFCYKLKGGKGGRTDFLVDLSGDSNVESGCRNPVLQGAGSIGNRYGAVEALFEPDPKEVAKYLKWLEKDGGIGRTQFLGMCEEDGKTSQAAVLKRLKAMKARPTLLSKFQNRAGVHSDEE